MNVNPLKLAGTARGAIINIESDSNIAIIENIYLTFLFEDKLSSCRFIEKISKHRGKNGNNERYIMCILYTVILSSLWLTTVKAIKNIIMLSIQKYTKGIL